MLNSSTTTSEPFLIPHKCALFDSLPHMASLNKKWDRCFPTSRNLGPSSPVLQPGNYCLVHAVSYLLGTKKGRSQGGGVVFCLFASNCLLGLWLFCLTGLLFRWCRFWVGFLVCFVVFLFGKIRCFQSSQILLYFSVHEFITECMGLLTDCWYLVTFNNFVRAFRKVTLKRFNNFT